MRDRLPPISPEPPRPVSLPGVGSGLAFLRDPTAFFSRCAQRLGPTFQVDLFGSRLLCVFSPAGVRSLWSLPENEASKGLADFALLRHKVPDALFAGRRTRPHDLFARDDVAAYLRNVEDAVADQLAELGERGEVELFALTRRLSHRAGLASWGGLTGAARCHLDPVIAALDRLDSAESFVHPLRGVRTVLTRKRRERAALAELEARYADVIALRAGAPSASPDLFDRICETWADAASPEREIGIARDVVLVHMGSQSNLFAANAWTLIHLLERPALRARVENGDAALLERCIHESIRLRQRSIVLRKTLGEVEIADEHTRYRVGPGAFLATQMSVTNPSALPGLDRFDPDHYGGGFAGGRFARVEALSARELVTTFGHGRHHCPAMAFSVASIRLFVTAFLTRYALTPRFRDPRPLRRQFGGVARADRPCRVRYALRTP